MASWCECIKAKEFFKWLNIEDDTCKTKLDRLNRTLEMFYMDTLDFEENLQAEWFWGSGLMNIDTLYPIYKFVGIYWTWCKNECFVEGDNVCIPCWRCNECPEPRQLQTFLWQYDLRQWQYRMLCDNRIEYNQYDFATNQYIVYSRWPKKITSMDDDICMSTKMKIAFQYLIEWSYAIRDREFNAINLYQSLYTQALQKIKWSSEYIPYSIWNQKYNLNSR